MRFSACLEMLFKAEAPDFVDRIALAKAAGFDLVEFWRWNNKDLDAVERALETHSVSLAGIVAEPMIALTDPANHDEFLVGLEESIAVCHRLGAPLLIAQAGNELAGISRDQQRENIVHVLRLAAQKLDGTGITLALEPLNIRVDHPGYYLHSTAEGLDIVDAVGSPNVRILYDIYHSAVMGEDIADVLDGRIDRVAHVHLADAPGRQEPGTGSLEWREKLRYLSEAGYRGPIGLEFRPSRTTIEALAPSSLVGGPCDRNSIHEVDPDGLHNSSSRSEAYSCGCSPLGRM